MSEWIRRRPVLSYLVLAYVWTWGFGLPLLASRRGLLDTKLSEGWEIVAAFGPMVAAAVVIAATSAGAGLRAWRASLLRWRVGAGGAALALATPFLLLALAVLFVGLGGGAWPDADKFSAGKLGTAAGWIHLIVVAGLVQGLGEEPGWRGYLLPRLRERWSPLRATLALFPVWLFWHLLAFLGRPEFGLAQFAAFSLGILAAAVWLTHIMETTRSTLMAVLWHALINIARGVALAISTPVFLAMSTAVLLGALVIVAWWLMVPGRRFAGLRGDRG